MRQRFDIVDGKAEEGVRYRDEISGPVLSRLDAIELEIRNSAFIPSIPLGAQLDELEGFTDAAVEQGELRAYLCPIDEISDEGRLMVDVIDEWNLPSNVVSKLRDLLVEQTRDASKSPERARSALFQILDEKDSWAGYTDDYEAKMKTYAICLFSLAMLGTIVACISFHFSSWSVCGLGLAGFSGSCLSVLYKMPSLEVRLSAELESYVRRILCRLAIGIASSVVGCGLIAMCFFPLAFLKDPFLCALSRVPSCGGCRDGVQATLVLLSIPMALGFLERPLVWLQDKLLGS